MRRRIDFTVAQLRRAPAHYRFFAVEESIYFGDEDQIRRVNANPELIDTEGELRQWSVSGGDFADRRTAEWIADQLNVARTVSKGGEVRRLVALERGVERAIAHMEHR